jgi:hypothetical protein
MTERRCELHRRRAGVVDVVIYQFDDAQIRQALLMPTTEASPFVC